MRTEKPRLEEIIERLECVERQNRRLKRAGAVGSVVAAAMVFMAHSAPPRQSVEAEQFVLKDTNGVTRASWSVKEGRVRLSFTDPSRKPELVLMGGPGPGLVIGPEGEDGPYVVLGFPGEGSPGLTIRGHSGARLTLDVSDGGPAASFAQGAMPELTLQVSNDGPSALFSDGRNVQMSVGSLPGVAGTGVSINDSAGRPRMVLAVKAENPVLAAFDSGGNQRLALGVAAEMPSVLLLESYNKPRLGLYGFPDRPALVAFDANGTAFFRVP